jgi:hypothetical protein
MVPTVAHGIGQWEREGDRTVTREGGEESGRQRTDVVRAPEHIGGKAASRRFLRSAPGAIPRSGARRVPVCASSCAPACAGASGEGRGRRGRGGAAGRLSLWPACGGACAAHRSASPGGSGSRWGVRGQTCRGLRRAAAVGLLGQGRAAERLRLWPACGGAGALQGG